MSQAVGIARFRQDGTALPDVTLLPATVDGRDLAVAPSGELYLNTTSRIVRLSAAGAEVDGIPVFASGEGLAVDDSQPGSPRLREDRHRGRGSGVRREPDADRGTSPQARASRATTPTGTTFWTSGRGTVYVVDRAPGGVAGGQVRRPATPPPPCAPPRR